MPRAKCARAEPLSRPGLLLQARGKHCLQSQTVIGCRHRHHRPPPERGAAVSPRQPVRRSRAPQARPQPGRPHPVPCGGAGSPYTSERPARRSTEGQRAWTCSGRFCAASTAIAPGSASRPWEAIAEAAGCCRETVRKKLRVLEQLGIIETIRRKVVASFTSRVQRVRFDFAVQTSNSYVFNFADPRPAGAWRSGAAAAGNPQRFAVRT